MFALRMFTLILHDIGGIDSSLVCNILRLCLSLTSLINHKLELP